MLKMNKKLMFSQFIETKPKGDQNVMFMSNFYLQRRVKSSALALIHGDLVIFPTETVYGIGADSQNERAVRRIYEVKNRPKNHPLIVHISSLTQLTLWSRHIPDYAWCLAKNFWPGPMTLVLPRTELAKDFVTGSLDSVAIRIPKSKIALALIKSFQKLGGLGIAAPSANEFGRVSPTNSSHVSKEIIGKLNRNDNVLNGGVCEFGLESTIIECTGNMPKILRPGFVTKEMVEIVTQIKNTPTKVEEGISKYPGSFKSHYSPNASIFLSGIPLPGDGLIALHFIKTPPGVIRLIMPHNLEEFARQLYSAFYLADVYNLKRVFVVPPHGAGLAIAINDRLEKAAANNVKNEDF